MQRLMEAKEKEISAIPEIGEKMAEEVVKYFADESHRQVLASLAARCEYSRFICRHNVKSNLLKKKLCRYRNVKNYTRNEIKDIIESHGGKVSECFRKTNYIGGTRAGQQISKCDSFRH